MQKQIELIDEANLYATELLCSANPVLIDVKPAIEVIPGMTKQMILTSGPPTDWEHYTGGQRNAIIGGIIHEGLANSAEAADDAIRLGKIQVLPCQDFSCVGSLAGVHTASMPVLVVEDKTSGNQAFCSLFEGAEPDRLNYGVYNDRVENNLVFLKEVIGPLLGDVIRASGGIELQPIIRRALNMGDELHSRNTAATLLFTREIFPDLLSIDRKHTDKENINQLIDYLMGGDYFFLRASMSAAKVTIDKIKNISNSSVVSTMVFSGQEFAIRVAGTGDEWFRGPLPILESCHLFEGFNEKDMEFMGGESIVLETLGLGGFAQASAFPLQAYQGGTPQKMIENNLHMYDITVSEHTNYKIPFLGFRGVPIGIDIRKVVESGITPIMDIGIAGKNGGQIGAGSFSAPIEPFENALKALENKIQINSFY